MKPTCGRRFHERRMLRRFRADVDGVQPREPEDVLCVRGDRRRAHDVRERFCALYLAVAHGHVVSGHELRSDRAAKVAGMELANVATSDETDDGYYQSRSCARFRRFTGILRRHCQNAPVPLRTAPDNPRQGRMTPGPAPGRVVEPPAEVTTLGAQVSSSVGGSTPPEPPRCVLFRQDRRAIVRPS